MKIWNTFSEFEELVTFIFQFIMLGLFILCFPIWVIPFMVYKTIKYLVEYVYKRKS